MKDTLIGARDWHPDREWFRRRCHQEG
jgi:hypothetical protein